MGGGHYDLGPASEGKYEPRLLGLPTVLRAWQATSRQILSGKQGDRSQFAAGLWSVMAMVLHVFENSHKLHTIQVR